MGTRFVAAHLHGHGDAEPASKLVVDAYPSADGVQRLLLGAVAVEQPAGKRAAGVRLLARPLCRFEAEGPARTIDRPVPKACAWQGRDRRSPAPSAVSGQEIRRILPQGIDGVRAAPDGSPPARPPPPWLREAASAFRPLSTRSALSERRSRGRPGLVENFQLKTGSRATCRSLGWEWDGRRLSVSFEVKATVRWHFSVVYAGKPSATAHRGSNLNTMRLAVAMRRTDLSRFRPGEHGSLVIGGRNRVGFSSAGEAIGPRSARARRTSGGTAPWRDRARVRGERRIRP